MEIRKRLNQNKSDEDKISMMPFLMKTMSMALKEFPRLNSLYFPESEFQFEQHASHNISIAIDSPFGLIAPNVKNCQDKSIVEIDQDLKRLRDLAKDHKIGVQELTGGTIAISNIGIFVD